MAKVFSAAGVIAAAAIAVLANVLVSRSYARWDWTSSGLYTLSRATVETLHGLREPVDIVVLLSASDPTMVSVRQMLAAYSAESKQLRPRYVDPDRNPVEFLTLQQKYGILAGKTEDGRVVTDASLIIARGSKHWYITNDDIIRYDENEGTARPHLEQALTEGLRNVLDRERRKVCFSTGHEELSVDDAGPGGLAELRFRLQKSNYGSELVELREPKLPSLTACQVLVIAGPQAPFGEREAEHAARYLADGGNLLALVSVGLSEDDRMQSLGLERLARGAGVELHGDIVIEADESRRLPEGMGETFFAMPKPHGITAGLTREGSKVNLRVLVSLGQSLGRTGSASATELLATSDSGFGLREIRSFVESGERPRQRPEDRPGPLALAVAAELPKPAGSTKKHGPRALFGPPNLAHSRNFREPTLLGNRVFIESALAWLAAEPAIVSVPEKPSHAVGLALTEESLGEVMRYVVFYMPVSAGLLGAFVLLRRRARERASRRTAPTPSSS
jgi:hypothetical protein